MATIRIGGNDIEVPELNFKALKEIFPIVKDMQVHGSSAVAAMNPDAAMKAMEDTIGIISIALKRSDHPMTPDEIEEALVVSELPGLEPALLGILEQSGLRVTKPGEQNSAGGEVVEEPAEEAKPSTATLTE